MRPHIDTFVHDSTQASPERADPQHSPNILLVVLDDVGYAQLGCYGSSIRTPTVDRIAREGLQFTDFHANPMCSPTRASLLTGRNCHSVGFGNIVERSAGFPGYDARLPASAGTLPEILSAAGYSTRAVGKWHLMPPYEAGPAGPFDRWPLGKGFDRYYGFLGASTDQYQPELYRDNSPIVLDTATPDGYHLTEDLINETIHQIRELRGVAPKRPFFGYLAFGACHTPHQVADEWIRPYRGRFDHGWDRERERVLERQIELGVLPADTRISASNPGVREWDSLDPDEHRLFARMMEIYAGFLTHTDAQIGRLIDFLEETGELDRTIVLVMSDNGASAEGGPEGSLDEGLNLNTLPQRAADALPEIADLGGRRFYNHYPWGWAQAGNTPFPWYKQFTHSGGTRVPCLLRMPAGTDIEPGLRSQYHHVVDVAPTLLEAVGVGWPETLRGERQDPVHGTSMLYLLTDAAADTVRRSQYYEMYGNRGLWRDGWMAVCRLQPDAPGAVPPGEITLPFDQHPWELFDMVSDPAQTTDVGDQHPELLTSLVQEWWAAAGQFKVLPIDTRTRRDRWPNQPAPVGASGDARWVFDGLTGPYERGVAPKIAGRSFAVTAQVTTPETGKVEGVLYALGGGHGGYSWYIQDGRICFEVNLMSVARHVVAGPVELSPGAHTLELMVIVNDELSADVRQAVDGAEVAAGRITRLLKVAPIGSGRTQIGADSDPPVSPDYRAPFRFDGRLHRVEVQILGESVCSVADEEWAAVAAE